MQSMDITTEALDCLLAGRVAYVAVARDWELLRDEFTGRMSEAINGMLLDLLAAVARKDYDDRGR